MDAHQNNIHIKVCVTCDQLISGEINKNNLFNCNCCVQTTACRSIIKKLKIEFSSGLCEACEPSYGKIRNVALQEMRKNLKLKEKDKIASILRSKLEAKLLELEEE